jgi:hypothetical protein
MTDYAFSDNFAACAVGPMPTSEKKKAWPDTSVYSLNDPDPNGVYFSIVEDRRFGGGKACRMRYPEGGYGMAGPNPPAGQQFYQLRIKSPRTIANLEFDWLFEDGFDSNPPNPDNLGGGKIGPCINWGEVGGVTEKRGTRAMWWYNANGSNNAHPVFSPSCQDQRSGDQLIQPVKYTKPYETERVYHFKVQIFGGPDGHASYWQDGVKIADSIEGHELLVTPEDDVLFDFAFFAGGGATNACRWDSYARHGNIKCWSGDREYPGNVVPPTETQYRLDGVFTGTITPIG